MKKENEETLMSWAMLAVLAVSTTVAVTAAIFLFTWIWQHVRIVIV